MNRIWARLAERYPVLIDLVVKGKTFTLPGFDGIPVYEVLRFFMAEIKANSLANRSKAIAFSFFLAIFPALTFVFSLLPYMPDNTHIQQNILAFLAQILPNKDTFNLIRSFLEPLLKDLAVHKRGGVLTGSFLLVIFLTSNGVIAMMNSFDKTYDHYKKRNMINKRFIALKITFVLIILFLVSAVLIVLGHKSLFWVIHQLGITSKFTGFVFSVLRYMLIVLMFFFSLSFIYYYGPNTKKKYKFISTGATVATVLSIILSVAFSFWVNNFNKLNIIFGSIGTVMLMLIWLNVNSFVLLIGYEINASIHYNATLRTRELEVKEAEERGRLEPA